MKLLRLGEILDLPLYEYRGCKKTQCIYFITYGKSLLYIGETKSLATRMLGYRWAKDFDIHYLITSKYANPNHSSLRRRLTLEKKYIKYYKPPINYGVNIVDTIVKEHKEIKIVVEQ